MIAIKTQEGIIYAWKIKNKDNDFVFEQTVKIQPETKQPLRAFIDPEGRYFFVFSQRKVEGWDPSSWEKTDTFQR